MQTYKFELPNEKAKTYRYVTFIILAINLFVFGFIYANSFVEGIVNQSLMGCLISAASVVMFLIHNFTKKLPTLRIELSFIILGLIWLSMAEYLFALCILCFAILGFYTNRPFIVLFTEKQIEYPSYPKKILQWADVSNVILKDRVLTIDCKNNKLIQVVTVESDKSQINEREFNDFCRRHLTLSNTP